MNSQIRIPISPKQSATFLRYLWDVALTEEQGGLARASRILIVLAAPLLVISIPRFPLDATTTAISWVALTAGLLNPYMYWRSVQGRQAATDVLIEGSSSFGTVAGPYWGLEITSTEATLNAVRCDVVGGVCLTQGGVDVPSGSLQWSTRSEMTPTAVLDIRPHQPRMVDVAYLDPGHEGADSSSPPWPLRIIYAGGERMRETHSLPHGSYRLMIAISSNDAPSIYCVCALRSSGMPDGFHLTVIDVGLDYAAASSALIGT